jgi:hypothetical protein
VMETCDGERFKELRMVEDAVPEQYDQRGTQGPMRSPAGMQRASRIQHNIRSSY